MPSIREQLMLDEYWGPDPAPFPHVEYAGEQANSRYFRDRLITTQNSMVAYPGWQAQELPIVEQLSLGEGACLSVLQDQRWQGTESQLEQVIAKHPLKEAGFTEDEDAFEEQARAATERPDYTGIAPAMLIQEDGLIVSRRRLTLLRSYVEAHLIGAEGYISNRAALEDAGVDADAVIKKGRNVVVPPLLVSEIYSMRGAPRGVTHLSKIVSAQAILPPEGIMAEIHIPKPKGR